MDQFWSALADRGARYDNLDSIITATFGLALDFLILDDARACLGIADPHNQTKVYNLADRILGCVFTIFTVAAFVKALKTLKAVKTVVTIANDVDKARDIGKAVEAGEDASSAFTRVTKLVISNVEKYIPEISSHSFDKHVIQQTEFKEIKTILEFEQKARNVIQAEYTHSKILNDGSKAFWNSIDNTLVIINETKPSSSTMYRPGYGSINFDKFNYWINSVK